MYKIRFNEYQKNIFSTVNYNGDKRNKLLSVFSYVLKYSPDGSLTKSVNKLYAMYIRYHKLISLAYFKKLINVLVELNLLAKENRVLTIVTKKVAKKVAKIKPSETIENTSLEGYFKKPKDKVINNTIYSYNTTEVVAPVEMVLKAEELLKDLNIKSKIVKKMVIDKLKTCKNINRAGFINYILKVIAEKKAIQEQRRNTYKANYVSGYNAFNDFEQREYTKEEYKDIEWKLLGWC